MAKKTNDNIETKKYPYNLEAEKLALSAFLVDTEFANVYSRDLNKDDFFNSENSLIYETILELLKDNNSTLDIFTVDDLIVRKTGKSRLDYLAELNALLTSASGAYSYIKIVKRDSVLRKIIKTCNTIIEDAYVSSDENKTLNLAEQEIYSIRNNIDKENTNELYQIGKSTSEYFKLVDERLNNPDKFVGVKTGYPILDSITNGFQPGNLIILAARPSVGKTAFALNLALGVDKLYNQNKGVKEEDKKTILLYMLEMTSVEIVQRLLANLSLVNMDSLKKFDVTENYHKNVYAAASILGNSGLYLNDASNVNVNDIINQARRLIISNSVGGKRKKIDLIVIDYIGLMEHVKGDSNRDDSLTQRIGAISRRLKIAARELNCPILILSQMSRKIEDYGRTDKSPVLSDLRDSGALEQDADMVMFLSREAGQNNDGTSIILSIEKNRHGILKKIRYKMDGAHMKFTEDPNQDGINLESKRKNDDKKEDNGNTNKDNVNNTNSNNDEDND